jgi:hypothetical protein
MVISLKMERLALANCLRELTSLCRMDQTSGSPSPSQYMSVDLMSSLIPAHVTHTEVLRSYEEGGVKVSQPHSSILSNICPVSSQIHSKVFL